MAGVNTILDLHATFLFCKMATTAAPGDVETQELAFIFKSLGETGEEEERWRAYTEHVSSYVLQRLSEFSNEMSENRAMIRLYGSAAEDLKCQEPDNVGDLDILIFPTADNLMIDKDLIEYLPEHPMHARIKGNEHPVLQSCLVNDTDYVATSALKRFHPTIFGSSSPYLVELIRNALQVMSRKDLNSVLQCNSRLDEENNSTSPAVTLNFDQSFGSISGQLEKLKEPGNVPYYDPSSWEWFFHFLCTAKGTVYTREHAEVVNDILRYVSDIDASLNKRGLSGVPQMFPVVVEEVFSSERYKDMKARIQDIERRSQRETGTGPENGLAETTVQKDQRRVTSENCHEDESGRKKENSTEGTQPSSDESSVPLQDGGDTQRSADENLESSLKENADNQRTTENLEATLKHSTFKDPTESPYQLSGGQEEQQPNSAGNKEDRTEREGQKQMAIRKCWFDHLFGKEENPSSDKKLLHEREGGIDFVPAFKGRGWPKVAREWIKRDRKWPSPEVVDRVIQEGFHLVVKPPKNGGKPDCDFRISFSHAEYLLSQEMNDIQRECYRCLKRYYRFYPLSTEPKSLVTFHLKNILLQTIEESGADMWTESNRVECMMKLLRNLLEALRKKDLRHFFVSSYNLFCADYIERPELLESLAEKVEQIMKNPLKSANNLIQKKAFKDTTQNKTVGFVASCAQTQSAKQSTGQESGALDDTLSIQNKQKRSTVPAMDTKATCQESNYRYHDLKDHFLAVSKELTDKALSDDGCSLEALDPLEVSVVKELRGIGRAHDISAESFLRMFDKCWDLVYYKVWLSTEPNIKRRMLEGLQGVVEMLKYVVKQDDFGQPGSEDAIARRLADPTVEDPFNLNHVMPEGSWTQILVKCWKSLERNPADMDDIPLD